jgi:hypothetical protein
VLLLHLPDRDKGCWICQAFQARAVSVPNSTFCPHPPGSLELPALFQILFGDASPPRAPLLRLFSGKETFPAYLSGFPSVSLTPLQGLESSTASVEILESIGWDSLDTIPSKKYKILFENHFLRW